MAATLPLDHDRCHLSEETAVPTLLSGVHEMTMTSLARGVQVHKAIGHPGQDW